MILPALKLLGRYLMPLVFIAPLFLYAHIQYVNGFTAGKSVSATALANLRLEHAIAGANAARAGERRIKVMAQTLNQEQARNNSLASKLAEQQRNHRKTTDRLSGEIARVNDLYREALDAPPKPLPACVFTADWVRVYDEATGATEARVLKAADPHRATATSESTRATGQLRTSVSQASLLAHHVQYAEQCKNTAAQLDLLIDQVEGK